MGNPWITLGCLTALLWSQSVGAASHLRADAGAGLAGGRGPWTRESSYGKYPWARRVGNFRRCQFRTAVLLLIYQTALACPLTQGGDNIPNRVSCCQGRACLPR